MKNLIIIIGTIILGAVIVNTLVLGDGISLKTASEKIVECKYVHVGVACRV